MKAVIFNSGLGRRMGALTEHCHKSMVRLQSGEAIFERQLRLLHECGITEFVVTVGPFKEQLIEASRAPHLRDCRFTFVENPIYDKTNYIYSLYLAREYIDDDVLMLHGDLVFDKKLAQDIIHSELPSLGCVNRSKPLPEKDFKARVKNGCLQEVSIHIFDEDCFAFQPFYKLSRADAGAWVRQVQRFIEAGNDQCYAENAMNKIFPQLSVKAFGYEDYFVDEVDNADDLQRVSEAIRRFDFAEQETAASLFDVADIAARYGMRKPMMVCGVPTEMVQKQCPIEGVWFDKIRPNPVYEDVCEAVELFRANGCDGLISIGGGSAIDTAKCIKLYAVMPTDKPYAEQAYRFSPIKHIAVPTTAGTGSESTRFAVIYYNGAKQSVTHDAIVPDAAVLDSSLLATLPPYQKKSTLLDALCQGIESLWSVNADEQSAGYAQACVGMILRQYRAYLSGDEGAAQDMMTASHLSGRAINLTQTTAAHAMSYQLTSLFKAAHGHAVAMCLPEVWRYIAAHTADCVDRRGEAHLTEVLHQLNALFGTQSADESILIFERLYDDLGMAHLHSSDEATLEQLASSVNPIRLGNNPVRLSHEVLREMYRRILA